MIINPHDLALALAGGLLIGVATVLLLWSSGRIAGISGISGGLLGASGGDRLWRWLFLAGLLFGGLIWMLLTRAPLRIEPQAGVALTIVGGLLVGYGTRLGNGCTSGHGVCGLSRRSPRSLAATVTFMLCAGITVYLIRHVFGVAS
ncbi:MAG: YeeE/YedE family protein [Stenotrophobium sp.]